MLMGGGVIINMQAPADLNERFTASVTGIKAEGANHALQRIAARWRMLLKPKGYVWAARGARQR